MTRVALLLLFLLAPPVARAGGDPSDGHTHGAPTGAAAGVAQGLATTSAITRRFEVVLKHAPVEGGQAYRGVLYLADYATNLPVVGATITLEEPGVTGRPFTVRATASPGVYAVERAAGFVRNGRFNVAVRIRAGDAADLVLLQNVYIGPVDAPAGGAAAAEAASDEGLPWLWMLVVAALGVGFAAWLVRLARMRRRDAVPHHDARQDSGPDVSSTGVSSTGTRVDAGPAAPEGAYSFRPPHP